MKNALLFGILHPEQNALLLGTRRIDWYGLSKPSAVASENTGA